MAEHDIVKHTKKIVSVAKQPGHIKHKIGDILLEIGIIVFAITLSLVVERYREHQQAVTLERSFLSSLVNDLKGDIGQLRDDSANYVDMRNGFKYLKQAYWGKQLNADSAAAASNYLYNTVGFVPSSSRYEALKASGKLDVIENKSLQIDIVNLYQQTIPSLIASTDAFTNFKNTLADYADHNLVVTKSGANIQKLMQSPVSYNLLNKDGFIGNILGKYNLTLAESRKIIKEIKAEEAEW